VSLIKGHIINTQIKSALAVEVLAFRNEQSQTAFLRHDASKALIRLLKVREKHCGTREKLIRQLKVYVYNFHIA